LRNSRATHLRLLRLGERLHHENQLPSAVARPAPPAAAPTLTTTTITLAATATIPAAKPAWHEGEPRAVAAATLAVPTLD
jgi:hypothetical protein